MRKRNSTTGNNGKSKKSRNEEEDEVNVSSDSDDVEEITIVKVEADDASYEADDASYEANDTESETNSNSDDEPLSNVSKAKNRQPTVTRREKPSNSRTVVTDEIIAEKELEVEAIISHKTRGSSSKLYCFKWKDAAKGETWENRDTARTYYPNHLRNYEEDAKRADQIEAILRGRPLGKPKFLVRWKDTARGQSWISQRQALHLCPDTLRKFIEDEKKANAIEAIVSHSKSQKNRKYLVKWKNHSKGETWETEPIIQKFGKEILNLYKKTELDKSKFEVEAIVSHRKEKSIKSYLVKWKDHSKGETWMSAYKLLQMCEQTVNDYEEELKNAFQKAHEVESILDHKQSNGFSKYLIKWKDHSKGQTWETARLTMMIGQDALDAFVDENPDCAPAKSFTYRESTKRTKTKKSKAKKSQSKKDEDSEWEDSDTDLESHYIKVKDVPEMSDDDEESDVDENGSDSEGSVEWEVEKIVGVKTVRGQGREFLIRWKGYGVKHDSWEAEEQLNCPDLIQKFTDESHVDEDSDGSDSEDSVESEVQEIIGVKTVRGQGREFLIRWKGLGEKYDSWKAEEELNCPDLIEEFTDEANASENSFRPGSRTQPKKSGGRALKPKTPTRGSSKKSRRK